MNREILFRGKRIDNGEWVYGYFFTQVHFPRLATEREYYYIKPFGGDSNSWSHFEVDPATVGQYTGLTDKNGRKIFEEDILRWARKDIRLIGHYAYDLYMGYNYGDVLRVISNRAGFMLAGLKDDMLDVPNANTKVDNYAFWNYQGSLEVIGNVWDNPELLEGE